MDWSTLAGQLARIGLPALGGLFGGPLGGTVGGIVGTAIAKALGTDATPEAVSAAIQADPGAAQVRLAEIEAETKAREDDTKRLELQLADVASARGQTVSLAQAGSKMAWGAPVISVFVLSTFILVMATVIWRGVPPGDSTVVVGLVETLKVLSVAVVSYWVGSSDGSRRSADTVRHIATTATDSANGRR